LIRVGIADDQDLVTHGLLLVLEARGCEVVGVAADDREAVEVVRRTACPSSTAPPQRASSPRQGLRPGCWC
jgi:hypothetical protein